MLARGPVTGKQTAAPAVAPDDDGTAGRAGAGNDGVMGLRTGGRARDPAHRLDAGDLGAELGERATLVQFSTAFCQPCRATRRILADVSALVPGVAHVEVDAESRLDLVRRLDVLSTPTVFVLDARGGIVKKASGQPRKADVLVALAAAVSQDPSHKPDEM